QPRRTIRIGLWSGEEEGLLGSKAYVAKHFGYYTNGTASTRNRTRAPKEAAEDTITVLNSEVATSVAAGPLSSGSGSSTSSTNSEPRRKLIRHREYDQFSAYFNLDN